ncbi:ABC transporter permease [Brachyspira pilosicoli]|uniref:Spermidine/putrescine transport ATP binding protein, PotB n=5 Tax=Brachyspira pilosicoli TaxID=52584 RepID=D8IES1_BRAP9|nr:ABC transporter permease [Brachyspira pilosicoli]ADK31644.1 spermidine/putrescine transport ATP binding protein, PotB [Brachyspira pilosicoli 95/1000]AFR71585.1 spermidine/putrescine transport ATP-binding protein PotB [Brachyspira pilosicoli B2904]AGA66615.1 spermidine/putrescine transport ATP-binding protein PotB [Brachyspira pilosicoli P43/6/78]MBW5377111.1 ABC transporter permease [Brachyspira pilosicoli]MBW5382887.1 ABC transporter permease [Brachyspira pilosicoli]
MKTKIPAIPYLIWTLVFILVPLVLVIYFAFTNQRGDFTIKNFADVSTFAPVIMRSVMLAFVSTLVCLILAYPLSYYISRQNKTVQHALIMLVMLPMWMNFLLRTYAWMTILEQNGLINKALIFFGLSPVKLINTQWAVLIGMIYNYLPFMILPLYSVMTKIHKSLIEASQDLGANSFNVFTKVVFPLSLPGMASGVTMVFVAAVSTFVISRMLGGGSNILIGDLIEMQFLGMSYNPNLGSAISLVLIVISLCAILLMQQIDDDDDVEGMLL